MESQIISELVRQNSQFKKLIENILKRANIEDLLDFASQGENMLTAGSFASYEDTTDFYKKNKKQIKELLIDEAEILGTNVIDMVSNFNEIQTEREGISRFLLDVDVKDVYLMDHIVIACVKIIARRALDISENEQ